MLLAQALTGKRALRKYTHLSSLLLVKARSRAHMEPMQLHTRFINMLTEKSNLEV